MSYRLNGEWILTAAIPYLEATRLENGVPDKHISGLSDIVIGARYSPWKKEDGPLSNLSFNFGLILPTGESKDNPTTGLIAPSVFQLGTGTTQLRLGANDYGSITDNLSYFSSLNITFPLYESHKEFLPAETLFFRAGIGYSISEKWSTKLSLDFFHGEHDEFIGSDIQNTGSTNLSITPSIIYSINDELSASISAAIPVYRRVNKTALAIDTLWNLGISYQF